MFSAVSVAAAVLRRENYLVPAPSWFPTVRLVYEGKQILVLTTIMYQAVSICVDLRT